MLIASVFGPNEAVRCQVLAPALLGHDARRQEAEQRPAQGRQGRAGQSRAERTAAHRTVLIEPGRG